MKRMKEMSTFSFEEWCARYNIGVVAKTWLENNSINDGPALRSLKEHHIPVEAVGSIGDRLRILTGVADINVKLGVLPLEQDVVKVTLLVHQVVGVPFWHLGVRSFGSPTDLSFRQPNPFWHHKCQNGTSGWHHILSFCQNSVANE